jgi:spore maturation protein CgeB
LRILILDTYYPAFLAAHYAVRPDLSKRPYDEQLASLMEQSFGTSDAYSSNLRLLGHEAVEIVANCQPLQVSWAVERGIGPRLTRRLSNVPGPAGLVARRSLLRRIALAQVEEHDPQVVYLQNLWFFKPTDLDVLHRQGRLVVGQIASALPAEKMLRRFDLLTTSFPHLVDRFRRRGLDAEYLKLGFHEAVGCRITTRGVSFDPAASREYGISLVGGLDPSVYSTTTPMLELAATEMDVDVWGYDAKKLPAGSPLLRNYHGAAWGLEMYAVLADSRIALNRHGDIADGNSNNMRLFEATAAGALLVTESSKNLGELFEPDREVVAYSGADDLVDKLRYYSEHENEGRQIAAAGQTRTLEEHTYRRRIEELAEILRARGCL